MIIYSYFQPSLATVQFINYSSSSSSAFFLPFYFSGFFFSENNDTKNLFIFAPTVASYLFFIFNYFYFNYCLITFLYFSIDYSIYLYLALGNSFVRIPSQYTLTEFTYLRIYYYSLVDQFSLSTTVLSAIFANYFLI